MVEPPSDSDSHLVSEKKKKKNKKSTKAGGC